MSRENAGIALFLTNNVQGKCRQSTFLTNNVTGKMQA